MKIEHIAFPVQEPAAVARWYAEHLGLRIVRGLGAPNYTHFLADESGSLFEIYNNPSVPVPDYSTMDPLLLHIAFEAPEMETTRDRLVAAGCQVVDGPTTLPDGDVLCMLRDPWGLALQLTQRHQPMR